MSETIPKNIGGTQVIGNITRVTNIGGRPTELYVNDLVPVGPHGLGVGMRRAPRPLSTVPIEMQPYIGISTDRSPQFGPLVTVMAQTEPEMVERLDKATGAMIKLADEVLVFKNADTARQYGTVMAYLKDDFMGLMPPNIWAFNLVNVVYVGAVPNAGRRGTPTPKPTLIAVKKVDVSDQYPADKSDVQKIGDLCVSIARELVTQAQLEGATYFTLSENGGTAVKYTIWNADSLKHNQTYDWELYLRRMQ